MSPFSNTAVQLEAITLRKQGYSYSEIQRSIPVSHATLSRWLSKIELSDDQKNRLLLKMRQSALKAKVKNKERRIEKTKLIEMEAQSEINEIGKDELLLIGTALYWSEGAKQKEYDVSQGVCFSNSDPLMVKLFLLYVNKVLKIDKDLVNFDIYIHENHNTISGRKRAREHWSTVTRFPEDKFDKIYFKRNKISGNRKNKNREYFGLLRVKIKRSTDLNRKINGWIKGILFQCGIV